MLDALLLVVGDRSERVLDVLRAILLLLEQVLKLTLLLLDLLFLPLVVALDSDVVLVELVLRQ